eukprot:4615770-Prymnesium_polylepis.1
MELKMSTDDMSHTRPKRLASYVRLVRPPMPWKPSVSTRSTFNGPRGVSSTIGSERMCTPVVNDVTPPPISNTFSWAPRRKARPSNEDFPVRVGPTALTIANGPCCARSTSRPDLRRIS